MMSSGSTVLRRDFDIFSIGPIATGSLLSPRNARLTPPSLVIAISAGLSHEPSAAR